MSVPFRLFIKPYCPWCIEAMRYLDGRGYAYERIDVTADMAAYEEMIRLSNQRLTPTLVVGERVLPDFDTRQLEVFLEANGFSGRA